jgi:hypothetical protein
VSVRVARGARSAWRSGLLHFRVQSKAEYTALLTAVARIEDRVLLTEVDYADPDDEPEFGAKYVSDRVRLPDGLAFWVDSPDASPAIADRIVSVIIEILDACGIDARLSAPIARFERISGPQVVMTAVPAHPPVRDALPVMPWNEIVRAFEWTTAIDTGEVFVCSGGATVELPMESALDYVSFLHRSGTSAQVVVDSPDERRELSLRHPADRHIPTACPHLGLARGGTVVGDDIDGAIEDLVVWSRNVGDWAAAVQVTVRPNALDAIYVRPPWQYEPPGYEATIALNDHVLDAVPWQRVCPQQVSRLPEPLPGLLQLDRELGELRCGTIDHWLREIGGARERDFIRTMRTMLGPALITRDVAWTRARRLPSSLPSPDDELALEDPVVDLAHVPIVPHPQAHPSLGVTPIELLSLLRGGSFDDRVDASESIRVLLDRLHFIGPDDRERVRQLVRFLAGCDVGSGHQMFHCQTMAWWLLIDLTPGLAGAVGYGSEDLRERIAATRHEPVSTTVQVLLDAITEVVGRHPDALDQAHLQTPTTRAINTVASGVADAASRARVRSSPGRAIHMLRSMIYQRTPFTDDTEHDLWNAVAGPIGTDVVLEAFTRAAVEHPRRAHLWREVEPGPFDNPKRQFAAAAASAPFRTSDPERAWDIAVERGSAACPDFWNNLNADLAARFSDDEIEASWAAARRRLALLHPQTRPIAAIAVAAACATVLCEVLVRTARDDLETNLHDVALKALDELGTQLGRPDTAPAHDV